MIKHNFKKLIIWQESLELVFRTYNLTKTFPKEERFSLVSQLNRFQFLQILQKEQVRVA